MKKWNPWIAAGLGLLLAGTARAGSPEAEKRLKELEKIIEDQGIHLETAKRGVRLSGVVDASYVYNFKADDRTLGFVDGLDERSLDERSVRVSNTDLWSWTLTAGFTLAENFLFRIEYRLDAASSDGGSPWDSDGDGENDTAESNIFGNNQSTQHTIGVNAAYWFW